MMCGYETWSGCRCHQPRRRWSCRAALYVLALLVCFAVAGVSSYEEPLPQSAAARETTRSRRAAQDDTETSGSGSGAAPGISLPLTCSLSAVVEPFSLVAPRLKSLAAECDFVSASATFTARRVGATSALLTLAAANSSALFADYLLPGQTQRLLVQASCSGLGCRELEMDLNLTVSRHPSRLLPYGSLLRDSSLQNVDDSAAAVLAYHSVPVFDDRHTQFYVSEEPVLYTELE